MKTCKLSILGGGVARELLKGLAARNPDTVARRALPQATFNARWAYRRERGGWDGVTYSTRRVLSGGLVAWMDASRPQETYSRFYRRVTFRVAKRDMNEAERKLNGWVTRMVRTLGAERQRVEAVKRLDKLCEPYVQDPRFMSWVEQQEKVWGESDYGKLTVADCCQWEEGVKAWAKEQQLAEQAKRAVNEG